MRNLYLLQKTSIFDESVTPKNVGHTCGALPCNITGCPTWESEEGGLAGWQGQSLLECLEGVNLSPLFDLTATFRSASSSSSTQH